MYDRIQTDELAPNKALMIYFPENAQGKQLGTFPVTRHFQDETAIYQSVSQFYQAGDYEFFVTILFPHPTSADLNFHPAHFRLLEVDKAGRAFGLEITNGTERSFLCVKFDLEMDLAREAVGPRYQYALGKVKYGEFETDASYLFAKLNGNQLSYGAATLTKLSFRNQVLQEALPNTFGLQLDGASPRTGYAKWRYWEDEIKLR
jgi:hypothetical protein